MENERSTNNGEYSHRKFFQQSVIAGVGLMLAPGMISASARDLEINKFNDDKKDKMTIRNLGKLKVCIGCRLYEYQCQLWSTC